jgi:hypothetical protein
MCCLYVMIMAFRRCCRKMIAQDGSLSSRKRHEHAHPKKMSVYRLKLRLSSWKYSLQQTTASEFIHCSKRKKTIRYCSTYLLPLLTFDSFPSFCIFPSTSTSNGPWLMLFVSSSLDALATRTLSYWFHNVLHVHGGKFIKFLLPVLEYTILRAFLFPSIKL